MGKTLKAAKKAAGKTVMKAVGKKNAAAAKKKGIGLFAPKTLSAELAAICGGKTMSRLDVTKKIWGYIKAKKLNKGREISTDASLVKIFPMKKLDMLQMAKYVSAHLK